MAIAGGAAPSFEAQIVNGELKLERQTLRNGVVSDVDLALQRLMAGETIFLSARSDVVSAVSRTIAMVMRGGHDQQAPPAP